MSVKHGRRNNKYRGQKSKIDARKCPEPARVQMRIRAVLAIRLHGLKVCDIAKAFGVCESCVSRWLARYDKEGLAGLQNGKGSKKKTQSILTEKEEEALCIAIHTTTPMQYGFAVVLWTQKIVAMLIERLFGKKVSDSTSGRIMRRHGMSPQKPVRRAYQRDEAKVVEWCNYTFPEIQARAVVEGAQIFWLDEAQLRSDHPYGTTWGYVGETPVVPAEGQAQRLNVIGTVGEDGFLNIMSFEGNMNSDIFCAYIQHLCDSIKGKIILILDNAPYHTSQVVKAFLAKFSDKLEVYFLPKYAPDLNPMELIWSLLKTRELNKRMVKGRDEFVSLAHEQIRLLGRDKEKCMAIFGKKELSYIGAIPAAA